MRRRLLTFALLVQTLNGLPLIAGLPTSNNSNSNSSSSNAIVYNHGLTTAVVVYDEKNFGVIKRCSLYMEPSENKVHKFQEEALQRIVPIALDFGSMMDVVSECERVDEPASDTNRAVKETVPWTVWSMFRGIMPGTKWCGMGDIAKGWNDLGSSRELDKCCRSHDHCPVRIHAFQARFGLNNPSFHTKSHCTCDEKFYDCLKAQNSKEVSGIGDFYFNVIASDCIIEDYVTRCVERDNNSCVKWASDVTKPKQHQFVGSELKWKK